MPIAACRPYHWFDIGGIKLVKDEQKKRIIEKEQILDDPIQEAPPLVVKEKVETKAFKPKIYDDLLAKVKERQRLAREEKERLQAKAEAEKREEQRLTKLAREKAEREYQALLAKQREEYEESEAVEVVLAISHYLDNHPY